jgi:Holliday junction resolvasome RuvABC ATP-dependent DNA helicase subunit
LFVRAVGATDPVGGVILFGDRGVGKTSLAQIVPYVVPAKIKTVRHIRLKILANNGPLRSPREKARHCARG